MTQTYRAILKGNQITWLNDHPEFGDGVEVKIVVSEVTMKEALLSNTISEPGGVVS